MFPQKPKPKEFRSAYRPSVRFVAICMTIAFLASLILLSGINRTNAQEPDPEMTGFLGPQTSSDGGSTPGLEIGGPATGQILTREAARTGEKSGLNTPSGVVGQVILDILNIIQAIFNWLVGLGARMLDWVVGQTKFTNIAVVNNGWSTVRDLANMFFALALLIIAFATILRLETYGMKQLLWKLVVAALLINFSFVIGGAIIDFTNMLMKYLIDASSGGQGQSISGDIILRGIHAGNLYAAGNSNDSFLWRYGSALISGGPSWGVIVELFLIVILLAILAYVLLASAFILLIRIVVLWIILIFAPLAWIAMVLPATSFIWQRWWRELFRYSFVAPVLTFFIYLALQVIQSGALQGLGAPQQVVASNSNSFLNTPQLLMQYFFVMVILLAGLQIARSMSIAGADAAVKMGGTAKSFALGAVTGAVAVGAGAGAGWAASRWKVKTSEDAARLGQEWSSTAEKWRQQKGWKAIVARPAAYVAGQASRIPLRYSEAGRKEIAEEEKRMETQTSKNIQAGMPNWNPRMKAAGLRILAKRALQGEKDALTDKERAHLPVVGRTGVKISDILTARPDWAPDVGENMDTYTRKATQRGMLGQMSAEALANPEVADSFRRVAVSEQALVNSVNSLPDHLQQAIKEGLQKRIEDMSTPQRATERDDFANPDNLARRRAYARITGNLHTAFKDSGDRVDAAETAVAAQYIRTMTPQQISQTKLDDTDSQKLLAQHMNTVQAVNIGRSGIVPSQIMVNIKKYLPEGEVKDYVESSETWGAQRPKPKEEKPPLYDASGRLIR